MSDPQQLSLGIGKPHRNHYLFSDHYLDELLRRERVWSDAQPQAAQLLAFLRQLYAREGAYLDAYSEAQLEEHWIKPILGALGHVWEPQAAVPGLDRGIKKPDYVFFADAAARQAAAADQRREEYARHALAVGEVKAWAINLSKKTAGAAVFDNNNPMFQIDYYLKSTGVVWGIASNGRFWRLVHRDSSYRLDVYFELDLLDALTTTDETRALAIANYFLVLFGQAAFRPDAGGAIRLDDVLRGSQTYARALESDLRDNAYKALEQLIIGFFAPAANRLDPHDAADRDAVYRHSLLLLYRLLFLFYGESRGLLPMGNEAYRDRSLTALSKVAANAVDEPKKLDALPPMAEQYWGHLKQLFTIINGDNADLNAFLGVPRYNGGLFDPQRHPFLAQKAVGDRHLIRAIDYLARRRKTDTGGKFAGFEPVDYRTLGVRQLGSIYEGLLEYRVSVAEEEMVTVRKGGKETWLPARERGKAKSIETKGPGELYLATDKGERKATGSYYTPDYIVKYIVEQTLGPLVEEARQRATSDELRVTSDESARRFEAEILALNVLDPAMGSGHFLVDATDYLARALATAEGTTADSRPPTAGGDDSGGRPSAVSGRSEESDLTYWRRRVVEACIYGVDKNELAVELAKLSLWLVTVAADKPLSFLDHHLRHGDSLIGAWLKDLDAPPRPQRSSRPLRSTDAEPLFDESAFTTNAGQAVGGAARIEAILTDDLDAVHDKERILGDIRDTHLGRWRQLADLWVSAWFGNGMSAEEYRDLARRVQGRPSQMSDEQAARYLTHPAVTANDYFHWELEFPEVFFDAYGRPKGERAGFDAVIGNPPYVSAIELNKSQSSYTKPYWTTVFESASGAYDLYVPFIERSIQLATHGGVSGLITPNKYLSAPYATALREYVSTHHTLELVYDVSRLNVFDDASVYPVVVLIRRGRWKAAISVEIAESRTSTKSYTQEQHLLTLLPDNMWGFILSSGVALLKRISERSVPLSQVAQIGASTTAAEADSYSKALREASAHLTHSAEAPILNTGLIDRYSSLWGQVALTHQGKQFQKPVLALDHPAVLQRRREMYQRPKLIFAKVALRIEAFCDFQGSYASMNTNFAFPEKTSLGYLAALCNSTLLSWIYSEYFSALSMSGGYMQFQAPQISVLPIVMAGTERFTTQGVADIETAKLDLQNNEFDVVADTVEKRFTTGDTQFVHDLLSHLAEQITSLYRHEQSLTADFWIDLEGTTDAPAFRKLRDKGKQEAGLAAETALAPFVNAASHSTRTLDESLAWDEAAFKAFVRALAGKVDGLSGLVKVYQRYAPRYRELVERIARTDWLIDQIVYQLYGLTDEEIAIVEGRA